MKKLITLFMILTFVSFSALADMMGGRHMTSGGQMRSSQPAQMMSREMMHDMTGVMQQMHSMTRDMNRIMENTDHMNHARTQEMSHAMEQLSQAMHQMSQHMANGTFNKKMTHEMDQHMSKIGDMIKHMEQQKK